MTAIPKSPTPLLEFTLWAATPLLNEWQRMHWAKRRRCTINFAWMVREVVGVWDREPIQCCVIHIERHSAGTPDFDGLYGGIKPLCDSLVRNTPRNPHGLGIIEDDGPDVIRQLIVVPVKCQRGTKKMVVRIYGPRDGDMWNNLH